MSAGAVAAQAAAAAGSAAGLLGRERGPVEVQAAHKNSDDTAELSMSQQQLQLQVQNVDGK